MPLKHRFTDIWEEFKAQQTTNTMKLFQTDEYLFSGKYKQQIPFINFWQKYWPALILFQIKS